jgi:hypothetical protein
MSYIDIDLSGYIEPQVIKGLDQVYTLKIVSIEEKEGVSEKKNKPYHTLDILCKVTDSEVENPQLVRKTLFLLTGEETSDQVQSTIGNIRRFKKAIGDVGVDGEPTKGIDTDSWINCEFKAKLGLEHSDEFGDRNTIKRIVMSAPEAF